MMAARDGGGGSRAARKENEPGNARLSLEEAPVGGSRGSRALFRSDLRVFRRSNASFCGLQRRSKSCWSASWQRRAGMEAARVEMGESQRLRPGSGRS